MVTRDDVRRKERELRILEQAQFMIRVKNTVFWFIFTLVILMCLLGYQLYITHGYDGLLSFFLLYLDALGQCAHGLKPCERTLFS